MTAEQQRFSIARLIDRHLTSGKSISTDDFNALYESVGRKCNQIKTRYSLEGYVTENQIENTICDFIIEVSNPTGSLMNNIRKAFLLSGEHIRDEDYNKVECYLTKCIFSNFKKNAEEHCKEYICFLSRLKIKLEKLVEDRKIYYGQLPKSYSGSENSCEQGNEFEAVDLPFVIKRKNSSENLDKNSRNVYKKLAESIELLLKYVNHLRYYYTLQQIRERLYDINNTPISLDASNESENSIYERKGDPDEKIEDMSDQMAALDIIENTEDEDLTGQKKYHIHKQTMLAGLAMFVIETPGKFSKDQFQNEDYSILYSNCGEADKIHKFLNRLSSRNLSSKETDLERTTAYNRMKAFKNRLNSLLEDYDYKTQAELLKLIRERLLEFYHNAVKEM